jgi:hypothetical protein
VKARSESGGEEAEARAANAVCRRTCAGCRRNGGQMRSWLQANSKRQNDGARNGGGRKARSR